MYIMFYVSPEELKYGKLEYLYLMELNWYQKMELY